MVILSQLFGSLSHLRNAHEGRLNCVLERSVTGGGTLSVPSHNGISLTILLNAVKEWENKPAKGFRKQNTFSFTQNLTR